MSRGLKGVWRSVGLGLTAVSKWLLSSEQHWDDGAWQAALTGVIWKVAGWNLHSKWEEYCCLRAGRGCFISAFLKEQSSFSLL